MHQQLQEIETLQTENQQLRSNLVRVVQPTALPSYNEQFFDTVENSKEKALSIQCINHLKQIGLAVRIWATDNEDRFPTSFNQTSNELATPIVLLCPADTAKQALGQSLRAERASLEAAQQYSSALTLFSRLGPSFPSYQLHLTGEPDEFHPNRILSQCPIHGHVGLADGSVQSDPIGSGRSRQEVIDGRLTLVPVNPPELQPMDPETRRLMIERYGLDPAQLPSPDPQ